MNHQTFKQVMESRFKSISAVLDSKAKEYSTDVDRLHNFKNLAAFMEITPLQACFHLLMKNFIALKDTVAQDKDVDEAYWEEKLGDTINYLILLDALWKETKQGIVISIEPFKSGGMGPADIFPKDHTQTFVLNDDVDFDKLMQDLHESRKSKND